MKKKSIKKSTLVWQDKTVKVETIENRKLFKMFPELEKFVENFEPVNLHITFQGNRLLTINFHK